MKSQMSVGLALATSYDLRYCKNSSREGEVLGPVFMESLDCGVPTYKAMAGNFVLCFGSYLTNRDSCDKW